MSLDSFQSNRLEKKLVYIKISELENQKTKGIRGNEDVENQQESNAEVTQEEIANYFKNCP